MSTPRTIRIPSLLLVLCLFASVGPDAAAQSPTFKSTTRVVLVDVVVTDGHGQPVHDLKTPDFTVLDNGAPQSIVAFEEHRADTAPIAPRKLDLPENVYTNYVSRSEPGALTVLLFDSLNTDRRDLTFSKNQVLDFLAKIAPGNRVALYSLGSQLRMIHSFTENADELIGAAHQLSTQPHATYTNNKELSAAIGQLKESPLAKNPTAFRAALRSLGDEYEGKLESRTQYTLDALRELAQALAVVPGRKNLIWISGGFPFDPVTNAPEVQRVAALLAATRIAVYPIDARGVISMTADAQTGDAELYAPVQTQSYETIAGLGEENTATIETMLDVARITGGRARFNTNDLETAIDNSIQAGSNYYSLAYRPTVAHWNGSFHKLKLKTPRPNLRLLYRSGYYAIPDTSNSIWNEDAGRVAAISMQPNVPISTQLIMKVRVIPPKTTGETTKIDMLVNTHDLSVTDEGAQKTPNVQFMAIAWDGEGKQCASFSQVYHATSSAQFEALLRNGLQVHQEIQLKPGSYQLRLGVMDRISGRIGTLDVPLTVAGAAAGK
jgi:VWFA-related protein